MSTNRTEKEQVRVHIRWMIRRDMPEVLQTEQESFEYSWTEEDFLRCLRQRNCIGMVAEQGERVAIVDYDAHHGNGTQDIFYEHPTVFYASFHQWPLYPGTGSMGERGDEGISLEPARSMAEAIPRQGRCGRTCHRGFSGARGALLILFCAL